MENHPAFYRFYIPQMWRNEMKIPTGFTTKCIQEPLPETVTLRDRYNNLWKVKVQKIENHCYFTDGWKIFVQDNLIQGGDVIVFFYLSQGLFQIKIYDRSSCEKKRIGAAKCMNTENHGIDYTSNVRHDDDQETDGITKHECGIDQEEQSDDDDDDTTHVQLGEATTNSSKSLKKRNHDWYGAEIFQSGTLRQPFNPYFVTELRLRKGELYIPKNVVKDHRLELPEAVILVDPRGQEYNAKRKIWHDGRVFYTDGWRRLCKSNFVGNGDKCICEFIPRGEGLYINVTFVRANTQ